MGELSIKCIGGVLYGLNHPANVDEFIYKDTITGNTSKYSKKILHGQMLSAYKSCKSRVDSVQQALNETFKE
ncbi:hypothetical protein ACG91D_06140 [Acinetobacter guillouiae]